MNANHVLILAELGKPPADGLSDGQANAIYASAYQLSQRGRHEQATALFALLGMYRPQNPTYTKAAAICFRKLGQYEDAVRMFARTMELAPGDYEPMFQLIQCLLLLKQREKAVELLHTLVKASGDVRHQQTFERASAMLELLEAPVQ